MRRTHWGLLHFFWPRCLASCGPWLFAPLLNIRARQQPKHLTLRLWLRSPAHRDRIALSSEVLCRLEGDGNHSFMNDIHWTQAPADAPVRTLQNSYGSGQFLASLSVTFRGEARVRLLSRGTQKRPSSDEDIWLQAPGPLVRVRVHYACLRGLHPCAGNDAQGPQARRTTIPKHSQKARHRRGRPPPRRRESRWHRPRHGSGRRQPHTRRFRSKGREAVGLCPWVP